MEIDRREVAVGLFVTIGSLLMIAALVWLGASHLFHHGKLYVSYFDQPVGAIGEGSPIDYLGIGVGRVRKITISPDPDLVAVVLSIDRPDLVTSRTVAQIHTSGLTGTGHLELVHVEHGPAPAPPELSFEPPHPVIPSQQSGGFEAILDTVQRIADRLAAIDIQGIVADVEGTAKSAHALVSNPDLFTTEDRLAQASRRLDDTLRRIDAMTASADVRAIPAEARATLDELHRSAVRVHQQIDALELGETSTEVRRTIGTVDSRARVVTAELDDLLVGLRETSAHLNRLLEELERDPSLLLLSKPARERRSAGAGTSPRPR